MALPGDVTTFTLTFGPYTDGQGAAALAGTTAKLFPVDPSTNRRLRVDHAASGQRIVPVDVTVTILDDGTATVAGLPHTGQAPLTPVGWAWRIEWNLTSTNPAHPGNLTFVVASGSVVDFDLLAPAATVPPVSLTSPTVFSVAGFTGTVTATQLATGLDTAGNRLSDAALRAAYVPFWESAETVTAGTIRMAPDGKTISRIADGTTRATYDATEQAAWTVVSSGGAAAETLASVSASGAASTLTLTEFAGTWDLTLTAPSVALTFAGAVGGQANRIRLVARQDATGGREITWPAGVVWRDAVVPSLSDAPGAADVFEFVTVDAGANWFASRVDAAGLPHNLLTGKGAIITATGPAAPTTLPLGSDGQVLTADSSAAAGVKWAAGGGGGSSGRPMLSGNRYFPSRIVARSTGLISAVNGYTYAIPIWLPSITVVNLVVEVTGVGGGTFNRLRLGIYSGSTGVPGALVVEAGTVDCLTTGVKTAPANAPVTAGLYWLSATVETDGTAATLSIVNNNDFSEIPSNTFTAKGFLHASITTGALPATFPYAVGDLGTAGACPIIAVDV